MNKQYLLTGLLLSMTLSSFAQSPTPEAQAEKVLAADGSPALVTFGGKDKHYSAAEAPKALREQLLLSPDEQMVRTRVETDALGFTHEKYQQYYCGVKVEHALAGTCLAVLSPAGIYRGSAKNSSGLSPINVVNRPFFRKCEPIKH